MRSLEQSNPEKQRIEWRLLEAGSREIAMLLINVYKMLFFIGQFMKFCRDSNLGNDTCSGKQAFRDITNPKNGDIMPE